MWFNKSPHSACDIKSSLVKDAFEQIKMANRACARCVLWNSAEGKAYPNRKCLSSACGGEFEHANICVRKALSRFQAKRWQMFTIGSAASAEVFGPAAGTARGAIHSTHLRMRDRYYLESRVATFFGAADAERSRSARYCSESLSASVRISIADSPVVERVSNTATMPSAPSSNISTR